MYINFNSSKLFCDWLETIYRCISVDCNQQFEISIKIVKNIKSLNFKYRGIKDSTDVLSFNTSDPENPSYLGDIILSAKDIEKNAHSFNVEFSDELIRCIVHGTLHIMGFDHIGHLEKDFQLSQINEEMFLIQERLLKEIIYGGNLPKIQISDLQ